MKTEENLTVPSVNKTSYFILRDCCNHFKAITGYTCSVIPNSQVCSRMSDSSVA